MLVRPKAQAITKRYIQVNRPQFVTYLVFDIDREGRPWRGLTLCSLAVKR
ncbi:TPA: replication initiation protein [Photobacterium damselae]